MLAHFIEDEGIATTQVSLIRIHTEKTKPPRALWVPFELGRPLGIPNNPAFQRRVLLAVLKLFEARSGPTLKDYPEDVPVAKAEVEILACAVSFSQNSVDLTETAKLCTAFRSEFASMRPWYDTSMKHQGRTVVGASGVLVETIPDFLCSILEGVLPQNPQEDLALPYILALVANDLKSYYSEAVTAQPGQTAITGQTFSDWFWGETIAGKVLLAIKEASEKSEDPLMQLVGGLFIVPAKTAR